MTNKNLYIELYSNSMNATYYKNHMKKYLTQYD